MKRTDMMQGAVQAPANCQLLAGGAGGAEPPVWWARRQIRRSTGAVRFAVLRCWWFLRRHIEFRTRVRAGLRRWGLVDSGAGAQNAGANSATAAPTDRRGMATGVELTAGDWVRVRSREEIQRTLDVNDKCGGCKFQTPMYQYCGQEFRVAKRIRHFFDEARQRMVRCKNIVLLEGVYCDGSGDPATVGCDRMCFYFWRTEWLQRIERPAL